MREFYCDACGRARPVREDGHCTTCEARIAPARRAEPAPVERRGIWRELCRPCGAERDHTRQGCTGCALRADNRKQGILYAVIGGVVIAIGLIGVAVQGAAPLGRAGRSRLSLRFVSVAVVAIGVGLAARGLNGVFFGADPERE